ncbi:glycosyltransferase family 4 protein [Gramella sp. MT6]|nr:glycosyltransferase family 4 protein [Gramella sp. MT6]
MVSIFAPHFFNWAEQLKGSGHEIYWLDLYDSNTKVEKIDFINQIIGWRYRWNHPGRYFLKKNASQFTDIINRLNERDFEKVLERKVKEIEPDIIHSFVIYLGGEYVLPVIEKYPKIKWIVSSWGSDLYYYRNKKPYLEGIQRVLQKADYLFTDCKRDHQIALDNGFNGKFLGAFPGGGGFDFRKTDPFMESFSERGLILIKGYQGLHGKCIEVLQAIEGLKDKLKLYKIVIFGNGEEVEAYVQKSEVKSWQNLELVGKIPPEEVMRLMGKAKIYIGNSTSDGMPNTLLEAIVMGAFPVQSNPGGVTAELIEDGFNGSLIENAQDISKIKRTIIKTISGEINIFKGVSYNLQEIKPRLERELIRQKVIEQYQLIEDQNTQV